MEDPEVVAAIVAGDPAGLAEAYDRYAMPLYTYCRSMLREPADAADAVQDTFLVATAKLRDLREPAKLRSWLYAVARNECLRRLRAGAALSALEEAADIPVETAELAGAVPMAAMLPGFRERVLRVLADRSPAGQAHRLTVANRAGPFGSQGFPKPISPPGAGPWQRILRHPRAMVAGAAASVLVAGAIVVGVIASPHPPPPSAGPAGGSAHSAPVGGPGPAHGGPPGRHGSTGDNGSNGGSAGSGAAGQGLTPSASPGGVTTTPVALRSPGTSAQPVPATPAGNSASAPSSPGAGTLSVSTSRLDLVSVKGTAVGTFTLTAQGGPVSAYSITAGSSLIGHISVSPATGSLAAGASVTITVTSTSLVALNGQLTVNPGGLAITVVLSISL